MKSKLLAAVFLALGISATATNASTITLDFEDGTANVLTPVHSYTVGGFQFSFSDAYYDDHTTFDSPWQIDRKCEYRLPPQQPQRGRDL